MNSSFPRSIIVGLLLSILAIASISPNVAQSEEELSCPEGEISLNVAAGAVGQELELTQQLLNRYMERCPNVTVNALQPPDLANDRFGFYSSSLGMGSSAIDVYQIDVTWPGTLAEHFIDFYEYLPEDDPNIEQHFPQIITNNTVDGRLVGLPWFTDSGLLYYRTDLLEKYDLDVPQTWDQLETTSEIIQTGEREDGNAQFWGYVWQGGSTEATTVNALEWQASHGGGVIINVDGEIEVNNAETITAVERAAAWIDTISPPNVLGHGPEDSRALWEAGNAAFMRNWPYAYSLGNDPESSQVAGSFDIALLPGRSSELRTGTLGGWQLSVSRYSRFPEAAVSLVTFMTSQEAQKLRAIEAGLLPTIPELYEDPEILQVAPFLENMRAIVAEATARPSTVSGDQYNTVSSLYASAVGSVLQGEEEAQNAMEDLEFDLENLIEEMGLGETAETSLELAPVSAQAVETTEEAPTEDGAVANSEVVEAETSTSDSTDDTDDGLSPVIIGAAVAIVLAIAFAGYALMQRPSKQA